MGHGDLNHTYDRGVDEFNIGSKGPKWSIMLKKKSYLFAVCNINHVSTYYY